MGTGRLFFLLRKLPLLCLFAALQGWSLDGDASEDCQEPPEILFMRPADGATDVGRDTSIVIGFGRAVTSTGDDSDILIQVHGSMSGKLVAARIEGLGTTTITLTPKRKFYGGEMVDVKTGQELQVADTGCPIAPIKWRFRIRPPVGHA